MIRLSRHQLFTLMFIFEVGSTTLFALGIEAKQDAWIVILIALLIGLIFVWIYTELQKEFPDKNYVEIITAILGKKLGTPLALGYALICVWGCGRNLREFGELVIITILPKTPITLIIFLFILVIIYTSLKGIEVLARVSEIIVPILIFFLILIYILLYVSGNVNFKNLMPILGGGIIPILKSLPGLMWFPFGEVFVFLMYWNYVNEKTIVRKISMKAILYSGILLLASLIMDIAVLGARYTSIATIPLVETIRIIDIGNIITHIDTIGILIILFGGFFKMTIYLNAIVLIFSTMFNIQNRKLMIILVAIFMLWFSVKFEPDFAYHKWMFPFDAQYFGIFYSNIAPPLLLSIYKIKEKRIKVNKRVL